MTTTRTTRPPSAVFIGDSVLDSSIWLANAERDAAYFLRTTHGYAVDDYSTDGNRVVDVERGAERAMTTGAARRAYVWHRRLNGLPAYRDVRLDRLPPSDVTVLSLGGNDILHCLRRVRLTADALERDLVERRVRERYERIVEALARRGGRLVLVVPYMPNRRDAVGWALGPLVERLMPRLVPAWYYDVALRHGAHVVDLSLEFDPYDDQLYGSTAIEPSELGNARIARLVARAATGPAQPPLLTATQYAERLDARLRECAARPRQPVPWQRRVWKVTRTLYFHSLLCPISFTRILVLLLVTRHVMDDQQRMRDAERPAQAEADFAAPPKLFSPE